jgi:hypothetical protein
MENNIRHLKIFLSRIVIPAIKTLIREALDRIVRIVMKLQTSSKLTKLHSITAEQNFHLSVNISLSAATIVIRLHPVTK